MAGDDAILVHGSMRSVEYAIRSDGSMPAKEFFDSLHPRDQAYLFVRFNQIANQGELAISNEDVFKRERKLPDDIKGTGGWLWAFKKGTHKRPGGGKGLIRIPCFLFRKRWILTHGFWKPPKPKWRESDYNLSFEIIREVLDRERCKHL